MKFLGSYPVGGPLEAGVERRRRPSGKAWKQRVGVGRGAARADPGGRRVIDLKRLRDEPEYRRGIERKRVRAGLIDEVLAARRRASARSCSEVEALRARQNAASKEIGKAAPDERAGEDRGARAR